MSPHEDLPGIRETDVEQLLSLLSIEEKVSLLSGADEWQTRDIERVGIGALKTSDGPAGARGRLMVDGPRSVFLPAPIMQAATWSKEDMTMIGRLLCKEAKSKSAQVLLAPTMCCIRNPLGGRNFESFSEDPYLSGSLAIAYVAGLQETGEVVATAKHFVANEQELQRFSINAVVDTKALREIYLRPFEMLMTSATPPGCVMTAYNCVNGLHMDMHTTMIKNILRGEWKFDGLVMSDWGGTNSVVESVIAGCDLEMPGPPVKRGQELLEALSVKPTQELRSAIDDSCRRILKLVKSMDLLGLSAAEVRATCDRPERSVADSDDLRQLRETVASAHVLLKNDRQTLPLLPAALQGKRIAFIGPNAERCSTGGGGSASMNPQYLSHPLEAFQRALARQNIQAKVSHAKGCDAAKWLPLADSKQWSIDSPSGMAGALKATMFRVDFFASSDLSGPILETQYRDSSNFDLSDSSPFALRESRKPYSLRITSCLVPTTSGKHVLSLTSVGHSKLWLENELLIDNYKWTESGEAFYAFSSAEARATMMMEAGRAYQVAVEAASWLSDSSRNSEPSHLWSIQPSVRLGFQEEQPTTLLSEAVALANKCDYTVLVVGLNDEWESEGYDRQSMNLPGRQDELIHAVLDQSAKPENVIIVNQSGAAVEMPWAGKAQTILQAWYGGQEAGNALADVILGITPPSGKLPFTWPKKYADLHFPGSPMSWPGNNGDVHYTECTDVGYRWYTNTGAQPEWWFGHGLTYSSFASQTLATTEDEAGWTVRVRIENNGSSDGRKVIQIYSWPENRSNERELRAFEKTDSLCAGSEQTVELRVQKRDMAHWQDDSWILKRGKYVLAVCECAGGINAIAATVEIRNDLYWKP